MQLQCDLCICKIATATSTLPRTISLLTAVANVSTQGIVATLGNNRKHNFVIFDNVTNSCIILNSKFVNLVVNV
ncbi:hypothetical protein T07_4499 [Trichinella nelsoni]|uniref:Uncharacterized protein n=1 Tax=Trichinella nelsoni TaxID=6336 RepID=A0A0V0S1I8_9BILA|nr:hypothetical protein T07_4499 [Trichinella nelsoni]